ncbi:NACHT domain-containing protein [Nocardia thraciensis]
MDYDLDRLGWREMEHLTQALALDVLGNGVHVFGDGPDGGREAEFEGKLNFPVPAPDGPWDGYGVIQVKHRLRSQGRSDNVRWLREQIRGEVAEWMKPSSKRGRLPQYFLVVTNVELSPKPDDGGLAKIEHFMGEEVAPGLGLKGWCVWDYMTVCRLLDRTPAVAQRYLGFIAPGDLLARLNEYVDGMTPDLGTTLLTHCAKEMLSEQYVTLGQAGDHDGQSLSLLRVAVDLPAVAGDNDDVGVVAHVIEQGERSLRDEPGGLVILGGPGQGKTTVAQLICQAYRVAQLQDVPDDSLTAEARKFRNGFTGDLIGKLGIDVPVMRRWPCQVRLDQYADALAVTPGLSLLEHIADRMSRVATGTITGMQLGSWLHRWPWAVVLDGLDEVPESRTRATLLQRVSDFRIDVKASKSDVLLVVTTRPQGYAAEFSAAEFREVRLRGLTPGEAVRYAERLAAARYPDDPDRRDQMLHRINDAAADNEVTSLLMRSPLQITIMALLLERQHRAPRHRFELYRGYYETVYNREAAKDTPDAATLQRHKPHIDALHARAGLVLQARAEHEGDAESMLTEDDLRGESFTLLTDEGFDDDEADERSRRMVQLAQRRLVLLVPRPDDGVGFEVRTLQEYFAARALLSVYETSVTLRLMSLVPSLHWRDTWLFAAGEIFAERHALRDAVLSELIAVNQEDKVSLVCLPAARLAIDLLAENVADASPRFQKSLAGMALELRMQYPVGATVLRLAEVLAELVDRHPTVADVVERAITDALSSSGRPGLSALALSAAWAGGGALAKFGQAGLDHAFAGLTHADPGWRAAVASLALTIPLPQLRRFELTDVASRRTVRLTSLIDDLPRHASLRDGDIPAATALVEALGDATAECCEWDGGHPVVKVDRFYRPDLAVVGPALDNPRVAAAFVATIDAIGLSYWPVASLLRQVLVLWAERRQVAHLLLDARLNSP